MNAKLVSSTEAVAVSRLVAVNVNALLADVAKVLSSTHVSLVVDCNSDGTMAGVIKKRSIVKSISQCEEAVCTTATADMMTRDVTSCRPIDRLPDVLSMMHKRGFVHIPVIDEHSKPTGAWSMHETPSGRCWHKRNTKKRCCLST